MGEYQMKQSSFKLALAPPLRQWFSSIHSPICLKCSPSCSSGQWPKQAHVSVPWIPLLCPCEWCLTEMAHGKVSGELWSMTGDGVIPTQVQAHFLHSIILSSQRANTLWQKRCTRHCSESECLRAGHLWEIWLTMVHDHKISNYGSIS